LARYKEKEQPPNISAAMAPRADRSRSPRQSSRVRGRARSVETDGSEVAAPAIPEPTLVVTETWAPKYNLAFMKKLMDLEDMRTVMWGDTPYADVFEAMAARQATHYKDRWVECRLATMCGEKLRLVPQDWSLTDRPAYGMPKLIRYAALLGMDYLELDLVASHPRQILKYAIEHDIGHPTLLAAFGSRQAIGDFRANMTQQTGLQASDVKLATNMACYGSSLKDWMAEHGIDALPHTYRTQGRGGSRARPLLGGVL
jgi:hypothetical protein